MATMRWLPIDALKPNVRNARTHAKKQIRQIADSITAFGFVTPILVDQDGVIIAGHGRHAAARLLELEQVPAIEVAGLSEAKRRALAIADNRIADNAGWDRERLSIELPELADLLIREDLDISITGFAPVEIDQLQVGFDDKASDPADDIEPGWQTGPVVSRQGRVWLLDQHRLLCGDARHPPDLDRLMESSRAAMAFLDPPYKVRVGGVVGRGRVKHAEFAMASGELSRGDFVEFLSASLKAAAAVSRDGAVHFVCMDWRHVAELVEAGNAVYGEVLNLVVWVKSNAGQGSFYRSQHELIGVFRVGDEPHLNNVELGRHGRSRSNVWHYGRNQHLPCRTDGGAPLPSDRQTRRAGCRCDAGLHAPGRRHPRYLLGLRDDHHGGGADRALRLRDGHRTPLRRCRGSSLASLDPEGCGGCRDRADVRSAGRGTPKHPERAHCRGP